MQCNAGNWRTCDAGSWLVADEYCHALPILFLSPSARSRFSLLKVSHLRPLRLSVPHCRFLSGIDGCNGIFDTDASNGSTDRIQLTNTLECVAPANLKAIKTTNAGILASCALNVSASDNSMLRV